MCISWFRSSHVGPDVPLVKDDIVSFSDPKLVEKINERLDLLSLPPSLTQDNLDRTLKELTRWPAKFSADDQILYAQHVMPTLVNYFHAVYSTDSPNQELESFILPPCFYIIDTIRECLPSSYRPDIYGDSGKPWLMYHIRLLRTLTAVLTSSSALLFDSTIRDFAAIDLSDAVIKVLLVAIQFPSVGSMDAAGRITRYQESLGTLRPGAVSLSEDARAKVDANLQRMMQNDLLSNIFRRYKLDVPVSVVET